MSCNAELILQPFRHFTYVTTYSPTLPSLYLRHSSFSIPSAASPTSQFILQPFFRFSYVTSSSLNSPGEPPMVESDKCTSLNKVNLEKFVVHCFRKKYKYNNVELNFNTAYLYYFSASLCMFSHVIVHECMHVLRFDSAWKPGLYLSPFDKFLAGIVHHQCVHLC